MWGLTYRALSYHNYSERMINVKRPLSYESHHLIYWYFSLLRTQKLWESILQNRFCWKQQLSINISMSLMWNRSWWQCTLKPVTLIGKKSRMAGNGSRSRISPLSVKMPIMKQWEKQTKKIKGRENSIPGQNLSNDLKCFSFYLPHLINWMIHGRLN